MATNMDEQVASHPLSDGERQINTNPVPESQATELSKAVDTLRIALRQDKKYYETWHANITMSIYDEFVKMDSGEAVDNPIHEASMRAADRFLNLLIK